MALWSFASLDYFFPSGSRLFAEGNLRYSTLQNSANRLSNVFPFNRVQLRLGYEHRLNKHWMLGASYRYADEKFTNIRFAQAYVAHVGYLGKYEWLKSFSFETVDYSNERVRDTGRFSAYIHIARTWEWGKWRFRPTISFEGFKVHEWEQELRQREDQRWMDKTRLRFSWNWLLKDRGMFGIFYMQEVDYFIALEVFDEDGELFKPKRRLNIRIPTLGVQFNYFLRPAYHPSKVFDLPF